ncbi:unnamed protein product [Clavelina lepadiformis]|uniref:P-type domain-containing protein n=1 Tax=Clavelina lepadiformis TaxID=159417 RepID=A0ABP0GY79_CLALP
MGALHILWKLQLILCFTQFGKYYVSASDSVCDIKTKWRVDCYPETVPSVEQNCESRGCCYKPVMSNDNVPWCYYPSNYASYSLSKISNTSYGYTGLLNIQSPSPKHYGKEISWLSLDVIFERKDRLHFRLRDANNSRYEVPISTPIVKKAADYPFMYDLKLEHDKFGIIIKRKSSGTVLFNSTIAPLIYFDQFLQISTSLPSTNVYGLGERHEDLLIDTNWKRLKFWARDQPPHENANLYGDHPLYIAVEDDGNAHGVFLLNSNAKEIELQPAPALTWRMVGGIMDFYVLLGPTPEMVVQQYTSIIGKPFLPPYWSLGFHLCRWGYESSNNTWDIVKKMRAASIPQDVQWNDIDYMSKYLDFTYDPVAFDTLPNLVSDLHQNNQHYVMIIDPGISDTQSSGSYSAYDDGIATNIFINDSRTLKPIEGVVWPGKTVFPDFTHPAIDVYWEKQLRMYHSKVPFDGVWIDMNEPSNFVHGSTSSCPNNLYENPPYVPHVNGHSLADRTLCSSSKHFKYYHYDVHSLTGLFEMKATSKALINIRKKRPFIISRSTFPSAGLYGGHWSGDIVSTWHDLKQSIASLVNFNMFGVPLVGADICGFSGDTTEELCIRWMQLGSFYPFSRNHNALTSSGQAPVDFSQETQDIMRKTLNLRYSLLPYLYSLFFSAHATGGTVAKALFFEFPLDKIALKIDTQFMWGNALLISPVLEEKASSVRAYFPKGNWYYLTGVFGKPIKTEGEWINIDAPLSNIPLHIRGGCIIPSQYPAITTAESRRNPLSLLVAPDEFGIAKGELYWDDGDSLDTLESNLFMHVLFTLKDNKLTSHVVSALRDEELVLSKVIVMNVHTPITAVYVNNIRETFQIGEFNILQFGCSLNLSKSFHIKWQ